MSPIRAISRRKLVVVALSWGIVLLAGASVVAKDPLFEAIRVVHYQRPTPAPDFKLATPERKTIALSELRGKVVFLNFWATWCVPCRLEMPSMERLYGEFKDRGLAVLAVDVQESPREVARFMKEFRLSFPALLDADGEVTARYRVLGIPMTFLIDRGGRIVGVVSGARNWASPEAKALIGSLIKVRP